MVKYIFVFLIELDALGDDLAFDQDEAYLDEASSAPAAPDTLPSDGDQSSLRTKVSQNVI